MKFLLLSLLVAISVVAGLSYPVYADIESGGMSGGSSGSNSSKCIAGEGNCASDTAFSFNGKKENVGIRDLAVEIFRFLSAAVGIAVVAGIATGGIMYSLASGNPSKTQKGMTIIINSVLGLVLYLLMFAIINFLVPGGVFT